MHWAGPEGIILAEIYENIKVVMGEYDLPKEDVDEILESIRERQKNRKSEPYEAQPA